MSKYLKIGDKLGYLNPKTGRYFYVEIVSMHPGKLVMLQIQKVGGRAIDNIYEESIGKVLDFLKQKSLDWKDGRPVMKHRSSRSNVMTEAGERYRNHLNKKTS